MVQDKEIFALLTPKVAAIFNTPNQGVAEHQCCLHTSAKSLHTSAKEKGLLRHASTCSEAVDKEVGEGE